MKEISDMITTLGYPVVMSLILLYMMRENNNKYAETIEGLRHTIENNTLTITKLCDRLETGSEENEEKQTV